MRLACVYALMACSEVIRIDHLRAALALWKYCEESAKYIFGMNTGDKIADEVYQMLAANTDGVAKTAIHAHFGRNKSAVEINTALQLLIQIGRIERLPVMTPKKKGRASEIFRIARQANYEIDELNEISSKAVTNGFNS